jgi:hypothetical protein
MTTQARRRLLRDFKRLQEDPPAGISGAPSQDNILKWQAVIFGYLFELDLFATISFLFFRLLFVYINIFSFLQC